MRRRFAALLVGALMILGLLAPTASADHNWNGDASQHINWDWARTVTGTDHYTCIHDATKYGARSGGAFKHIRDAWNTPTHGVQIDFYNDCQFYLPGVDYIGIRDMSTSNTTYYEYPGGPPKCKPPSEVPWGVVYAAAIWEPGWTKATVRINTCNMDGLDPTFSTPAPTQNEIAAILAHEMGHHLGLRHLPCGNLMQASSCGFPWKWTAHADEWVFCELWNNITYSQCKNVMEAKP